MSWTGRFVPEGATGYHPQQPENPKV